MISRRERVKQLKQVTPPKTHIEKKPPQRKSYKKLVFFIVTLFLIVFFISPLGRTLTAFFYQYFFSRTIELNKNTDNSVNVLLLGIGGGKHDGPNLSDTIIFAHIDPKLNSVNLISLPRDIWIADEKSKINALYATGQDSNSQGIPYAKKAFEKILGQKINYTVVVNFAAFTDLVDLLGGVEVNVKNTLDDYEYPIEGKENELCGHPEEELPLLATASSQLEAFPCRYEHLHFNPGKQTMDGKTALAFARSRHGQGIEGSDFARSARQHLVISAIRQKLLSLGTLLNPVKLFSIYNVLKDNINTDIPTNDFDDFLKLFQRMKNATINTTVIDTGSDVDKRIGLLINPPISELYGGAWVLVPRVGDGDFSEIQKYIGCILMNNQCVIMEKGVSVIDKKELEKNNKTTK